MGNVIILAIFIGGGIGVLAGAYFLYLLSEPSRWEAFSEKAVAFFDNRYTRWVFDRTLGAAVNLKTIEECIEKGDFGKAADLAVAEGLVEETVASLDRRGKFLEGARLAKRVGYDELAHGLFRDAIDAFDAESNPVAAAEAADEAGFAEEAVKRFEAFGGAASGTRAAKIAAAAGMADKAIALHLFWENLLDAARLAENFGREELLFDICDKSDNPALHVFASEAAARKGDLEKGVSILERHGLLHQAAQFAKQNGMTERLEGLIEKIRETKAEIARKKHEEGFGRF